MLIKNKFKFVTTHDTHLLHILIKNSKNYRIRKFFLHLRHCFFLFKVLESHSDSDPESMFEYSLNGDEEESNNSSNSNQLPRRRRNPNQQEEEKKLLDSESEQYIDPTLIVFPDGTVCIGLDHKNP